MELGVFDDFEPSPEATRRTELMADAFAAYEVSHARGATFRTKRLVEAVASAFEFGDCAFDNPGHHGTPDERAGATQWGIDAATDERPSSTIIAPAELVDQFDAALPDLVH